MQKVVPLKLLGKGTRLGLATRGNTSLDRDDVQHAVDRGVNWLNWCGHTDGLRDFIRRLGPRRSDVRISVQFSARTRRAAERELGDTLADLGTNYLDAATYYYVEDQSQWDEITAPDGAAQVLEAVRSAGTVRAIGLTSHQRKLAAQWACTGRLDLLMIRYNAAHRGAEEDVFPVTDSLALPVIAFTCLRWGALLRSTPNDPPDFIPPSAPDCYRFVLSHRGVSVALMAPNGRAELEENLSLLDSWAELTDTRKQSLAAHGERVRQNAGMFP